MWFGSITKAVQELYFMASYKMNGQTFDKMLDI